MRLQLHLPEVLPTVYPAPRCPLCQSPHVQVRQCVPKALRDSHIEQVIAERYDCRGCGRTFRVYPVGVSQAHTSARLRGTAVMLYLLGLSYGAVSLALGALGIPLSKTAVYAAVQAAGERVAHLRRERPAASAQQQVAALGVDLTSVKCRGQWLTVGVSVDAVAGLVLSIDLLPGGDATTLSAWITEIAQAVGAEVLVTDDADGFKTAADAASLSQQVCVAHVARNTDAWIAAHQPGLAADADGSLAEIGVTPEQAATDLATLQRLIHTRDPGEEGVEQLRTIHQRYVQAATPRQRRAEQMTLAYKLRLFTLDRWLLYRRLTFYRTWTAADGTMLDGTNNVSERAIGWWIKERYRSMRGYKREQSIQTVTRLTAWAGNQLTTGGADLTQLVS
jgi:transposase-like protein